MVHVDFLFFKKWRFYRWLLSPFFFNSLRGGEERNLEKFWVTGSHG